MLSKLKQFVPNPAESLYKGQMGRLGVLGGSEEYTGAPYFAAISILKSGVDLVHVFCPESASIPIKSYSPDIIVHPTLMSETSKTAAWFKSLNAFVFGPGLGRSKHVLMTVNEYLINLRGLGKPIVIDADGLLAIMNNLDIIKGYNRCILTPNKVEFERLYELVFNNTPTSYGPEPVKQLAISLGVTICLKGREDLISNGTTDTLVNASGSPRRCGGQGDVLSGAICAFAHWFSSQEIEMKARDLDPMICATVAGCTLTRECARVAFSKHGRGMVTQNLIEDLVGSFDTVFK